MGKFKAGDKVRWANDTRDVFVSHGVVVVDHYGNQFVVDIQKHRMTSICDESRWELDTEAQPEPKPMLGTIKPMDTTLKSGPLEGRKVISKELKIGGVIFWDQQNEEFKIKTDEGLILYLTHQFELVGDDPVESKSDDRIDALEKRVADLEKKAKSEKNITLIKSEEAIIREFVEWMTEEGWGGVSLHQDTERYIKDVLK